MTVTTPTSTPPSEHGDPALVASGMTKSFFGNTVLADLDLTLRAGEVHGLVGENGAGKSTLMKMLAGVHTPDSGTIVVGGEQVSFGHPVQAQRAGVATVFQEFNLLLERTIAENIWLGREPRRFGRVGPVDTARMRRDTDELLAGLGVSGLKASTLVRSLSVAEQQIVEIAKAVSFDATVIQMDEPTAALADHEVELLYGIIERLTERGVAILYVSHRLKEVFHLCRTITVLKDGRHVATRPVEELTEAELVRLMVGRPLTTYFPEKPVDVEVGEVRLALDGVGNGYVDGVSLEVRAGEIVGLAGLQGSGRTELLETVFGVHAVARGTVSLDGRPISVRSPRQGVRARLAFITEDRKAKGLALNQSILDNTLGVVRSVFPRRTAQARRDMPGVLSNLDVAAASLGQEVQFLSGGNQQKVVLARWLSIDPLVVLMDEPTRGIDVGAKHRVYELMRELTRQGVAVLMVSSELPEVIGMSDRILVMRDGRLAGELPAGSSEESVLAMATGAAEDAA
ncbi:monosaccharide ABC transporter ATP-binding protein, CUT2 family [Nocardioides exalbidus]|uniref:Monosaccharide ABC transporter ATP-binding protein, CUT2 family n=1 Tax=Nocardioides exalbidus TaxID=402596 RepID=A0A1H4UFQ2_9ACTN|nr:sugar ABC transporter ATP-binding protein [Nocardioides exalbidus]SEC67473.1 monosaccharide ABC transporter ATP-binding protein, CUT2 family [Nocardioides exalbidus]